MVGCLLDCFIDCLLDCLLGGVWFVCLFFVCLSVRLTYFVLLGCLCSFLVCFDVCCVVLLVGDEVVKIVNSTLPKSLSQAAS